MDASRQLDHGDKERRSRQAELHSRKRKSNSRPATKIEVNITNCRPSWRLRVMSKAPSPLLFVGHWVMAPFLASAARKGGRTVLRNDFKKWRLALHLKRFSPQLRQSHRARASRRFVPHRTQQLGRDGATARRQGAVYWLPKGRSKACSAIGIRILSSTIHLSQAGALAADTAAP